jgi:hypothetical protein
MKPAENLRSYKDAVMISSNESPVHLKASCSCSVPIVNELKSCTAQGRFDDMIDHYQLIADFFSSPSNGNQTFFQPWVAGSNSLSPFFEE